MLLFECSLQIALRTSVLARSIWQHLPASSVCPQLLDVLRVCTIVQLERNDTGWILDTV